jgi:signal transduction histidine kinase
VPPLARSWGARADAQRQQKLLGGQINLQELPKDSVASLSRTGVERNIDLGLETEVASEASVTRGDRSALQILLRNLIDNALRHMPSAGR